MLIVGELINTSRKSVKAAVDAKDAAFVQQLARDQVAAGADYMVQIMRLAGSVNRGDQGQGFYHQKRMVRRDRIVSRPS